MKGRSASHLLLVGILALTLQSCANTPEPEPVQGDYSSLKREELEALAASDQEACIEALSFIAQSDNPDSGFDTPTISAMASVATNSLIQRLHEELAAEKWSAAEGSIASLKAIATLADRDLADDSVFAKAAGLARTLDIKQMMLTIYKGRLAQYTQRNLYSPAASTLHKVVDLAAGAAPIDHDAIGIQLLDEWLERAYAAGDAFTVAKILSLWPEGEKKYPVSAKAGKTLAENAEAVVTVYVDKGLRIENGIGYPDRVLGTAFQVDPRGYYITNYHVVASEVDPEYDGYSRLSVRPSSNPEARIPAKVIGWDEALDLALIKSQETSISTIYPFGEGKAFKGQKVYVIGSPVGLESSVAAGIVSATGRRILSKGEAVQIDAPVNPGNSGGPLLDENGELIAVVFAGLSGYQGLNFALPVSWVSAVFTSLFEEGRREASWLGLGLAKSLDGGLDVVYVFPGKGGIDAGDRLISIDGERVVDIEAVQLYMAQKPIGSLCAIETEREGQLKTQLRKTTELPLVPFEKASSRDMPERLLGGATGMILEQLAGPRSVGGTYKILKTWPGLAADESGLGQSDVLKFLKYSVDIQKHSFFFDVSVKSLNSGYLERRMRMNLSLETDNFI
ncbi:MAG: hypothetical protein CVV53_02610 [Spirochaetae bacterium HGW-Spirochaetae-9]|nr:MAG: hypothetical protein CVV53_02610 [Spirochaetae bacterium HGW-Spirochaetae-9]